MREIQISRGMTAFVDDEDYDKLSRWKWCASVRKDRKAVYAYNGTLKKLMHRAIMEVPEGMQIDHINHNGLDNRKENLRLCTQVGNMANRGKFKNKILSRFKRVKKVGNRWAVIVGGKHRGSFGDEVEAARFSDQIAKLLYGEYAWLNFPNIESVETTT